MVHKTIDPGKYINYLVEEGFNNQVKLNKSIFNRPINLLENNLSLVFNEDNNEFINYIFIILMKMKNIK